MYLGQLDALGENFSYEEDGRVFGLFIEICWWASEHATGYCLWTLGWLVWRGTANKTGLRTSRLSLTTQGCPGPS